MLPSPPPPSRFPYGPANGHDAALNNWCERCCRDSGYYGGEDDLFARTVRFGHTRWACFPESVLQHGVAYMNTTQFSEVNPAVRQKFCGDLSVRQLLRFKTDEEVFLGSIARGRAPPRSCPRANLTGFLNARFRPHVPTRPLTFELHVANLDNNTGAIVTPPGTKRIFMEIGCSDVNTLDDDVLDLDPEAFLLSFEPMLDKWAVLAARGTSRYHGERKDLAVPLGHHHRRGHVLPLAVSTSRGATTMHISRIAGCSSLRASRRGGEKDSECRRQSERRVVPAITLGDALALAPAELPVRLLKLDAQGLDLAILRVTPPSALARVQQLTFEVHKDSCALEQALYERETCAETLLAMKALGFRMAGFLACAPLSASSPLRRPYRRWLT